MKQEQSIGSHNQQQGLPENRNQDTSASKKEFHPGKKNPVKPAVTDDEGNLHSKNSNLGKGYSEPKPTEAWSTEKQEEEKTAIHAPEDQPKSAGKVYGDNHQEHVFEEHPSPDDQDESQRRKQAGKVQG